MTKLNQQQITKAVTWSFWDVANEVLYSLCKQYPRHGDDREIAAKVWLIGRSYSAAIERTREPQEKGDPYYINRVAPMMRSAKIDDWLAPLRSYSKPTPENCSDIIAAHKKLTNLFFDISKMEKRSLASKYLHFHLPHLFYIYDSQVANAIPKVTDRVGKTELEKLGVRDEAYARFFLRCLDLVKRVNEEFGIELSPRQLDNYLLKFVE